MKSIRGFFVLTLLWAGAGCSTSTNTISFSGTWSVLKEDGISDQKETSTLKAQVHKEKFRIAAAGEESQSVSIYDGKNWREETIDRDGKTRIRSGQKRDMEVETFRFWKLRSGAAPLPGGRIAGRETLLYQQQDNRPEGVMTAQLWVDSEHEVVLKRVFTIYSKQIEQMVKRTTEECQEIKFGPVDDGLFTKI